MFIVLKYPTGNSFFVVRCIVSIRSFTVDSENVRFTKLTISSGIYYYVCVKQLYQLTGGDCNNFIVIFGTLKQLISIKKDLGSVRCLSGYSCVAF